MVLLPTSKRVCEGVIERLAHKLGLSNIHEKQAFKRHTVFVILACIQDMCYLIKK